MSRLALARAALAIAIALAHAAPATATSDGARDAASDVTVIVLDVRATAMTAATTANLTKLLARELGIAMKPARVIDVGEHAGCNEPTCLAEAAMTHRAGLVVFGDERVEDGRHVVTLQLFDAARSEVRARTTVTVAHVGDLAEHVPTAVRALAAPHAQPARAQPAHAQPARAEPAAPTTEVRPMGDMGDMGDTIDVDVTPSPLPGDSPLETAGYVAAGGAAGLGVLLLLSASVVLTTPEQPDDSGLGFGLFGAGLGMIAVVAPSIAGATWLFCGGDDRT